MNALGVPPKTQDSLLHAPSATRNSHHTVAAQNDDGVPFSRGVPGTWVPFGEATELAKMFKMPTDTLMSSILREDLFQLVRRRLRCMC
jgi:hypothetical protein